ncbi:MAG: hypothetical protein IAG13_19730, partial [Deltaproteobacteria bacterium]|nr:hypothetical protein [Nannocystaceae bacterium]
MDEQYEPIDLSAWRVRELPSNFADDVIARLDALDRSLAEELEVIDDELGDTLHAIDDELEAVRPRASVHALPRPSKRPVLLATVFAAAAATLVLVWPEP